MSTGMPDRRPEGQGPPCTGVRTNPTLRHLNGFSVGLVVITLLLLACGNRDLYRR